MAPLSKQERIVVNHIVQGRTSKEIADLMILGVETVRSYRRSAMKKLGAHSVAEVIAHYNLTDPDGITNTIQVPDDAVAEQLIRCAVWSAAKATSRPGLTFEDGVAHALSWALGYQPTPPIDCRPCGAPSEAIK